MPSNRWRFFAPRKYRFVPLRPLEGGVQKTRHAHDWDGLIMSAAIQTSGPATAGAYQHVAALSGYPTHQNDAQDAGAAEPCIALRDVLSDAEGAWMALAVVVDMLRGCAPGHQLSAGGLLRLLEPVAGTLDVLCSDLGTVALKF
jgi:hypothetical protein